MLRALQRNLIFPRHHAPPDPTCFARVPDLERLWLDLDGGERVEAFFLAARNLTGPAPAVIFAHGNAELIDYHADAFEPWRQLGVHTWSCGHNDSPPPNQAAWWRDLRRFVEEAGLLDG